MNSSYEEELDKYGSFVFTNVGTSMMPLLRQNRDLFVIEKKTGSRFRKYDVVLFKRANGQYVLHRILKVMEKDYVLCGDNQFHLEYGVTDEQILGVMTKVIRDGATISVKDIKYRLYTHLWCDFYFVRASLLWFKSHCKGMTIGWTLIVAGRKKFYIIILLLLQIILGGSSVFYAMILRNIVDWAVEGNRQYFFESIAAFAGLVIFQIILWILSRHLEELSRSTMENQFKQRFLSFLLNSDYSSVSAVHSGEWMNRLTSDTVIVADGLAQIIPTAAGMIVKMVGALLMILILEPSFGYILIPGGILMMILSYGFRKVLKKLHTRVQEADGVLRVFLQERLESMIVVHAFAKEEQSLFSASDKMEIHKKARMRKNRFSNICNAGFSGVMQGAYLIGAGFCGYGILTRTMSYGTFMAVLQLISQIQSPFANITGYMPKYYAMLASAERLQEVEKYEAKLEASRKKMKTMIEINLFYQNKFRAIYLQQVEFSYHIVENDNVQMMRKVLKGINLKIRKGEYVAFTGPSGCGKSTIMKLLLCLYSSDKGKILIEMTNEKSLKLTAEYRRLFAYVPQGNQLMSGTIREIITFSDKLQMQNEDDIWRALKIACAESFVKKLMYGLDSVLGERGSGLSEGQMQRIAIARAIFSDHPILMLDESTSALDKETEKQLLINLRTMTDKTVLIVTHRMEVLNICDKEIRFSKEGVNILDYDKERKKST